jgi:hypothetical protein
VVEEEVIGIMPILQQELQIQAVVEVDVDQKLEEDQLDIQVVQD